MEEWLPIDQLMTTQGHIYFRGGIVKYLVFQMISEDDSVSVYKNGKTIDIDYGDLPFSVFFREGEWYLTHPPKEVQSAVYLNATEFNVHVVQRRAPHS
jgi:hypothetical protein